MSSPPLSYLRVYEPLRAFDGEVGETVRAALSRAVPSELTGLRERQRCLRARLDGRALPTARVDVLVTTGPGGDQLICPLDTRVRAAAALLTFLETAPPVLAAAALPVPARVAMREAQAAMAELGDGPAHVVSETWTVPLPWFALVRQSQRRVRTDPLRVWWQVPIEQARRRTSQAESVVRRGLGDDGPAEVLAEVAEWLDDFDDGSVVELDYGGLVDLFDEPALRADTSAADVAAALRALRDGDAEAAGVCYERLREFWSRAAARERHG